MDSDSTSPCGVVAGYRVRIRGERVNIWGALALESCCRSFGDSLAQAFGAIWLSRGSSAVIVLRAIVKDLWRLDGQKNGRHRAKRRT